MNDLYLARLPMRLPALLRFAAEHGIDDPDPTQGYTVHAWLAALFGESAPKPFRYLEKRDEVLGYTRVGAEQLLYHARAYASPLAWTALNAEGVASKPMPTLWRVDQRLRLEVLACPVVRRDQDEKDAYLHALDRLGDAAPTRAEVYRDWFAERCAHALRLQQVEVRGMQARSPLLRRARNGQNRLKTVERPRVLFVADASINDDDRFAELLARGIGRHRTFGFGMILLAPSS